MGPTRRETLRAAAALPALFALGCTRGPSWFAAALRRIRNEGRAGLVIRLPKDPAARCALGHKLSRISSSAVLICLETEDVEQLLYGARESDDLLRIDANGNVLDGRPLDPKADLGALLGVPGAVLPTLPYGVSIGTASGCAENPACFLDTCCFCGMGAVAPRAGQFIKFLAK